MAFLEECIILANLLTILTFTINRHLRKRSVYSVINLAVADMLFGIGVLVKCALRWKKHGIEWISYEECSNPDSSYWVDISNAVLGAGTLSSLALVAVERMCATVWPFRHRSVRSGAYTLAFSMMWMVVVIAVGLVAAITLYTKVDLARWKRLFLLLCALGACVLVAVICVSYLVIFIKVKQQQQQMAASQRVSRPDQKLVMTLFIMTLASIGTWIPLAVYSLLTAKRIIVVSNDVLGAVLSLAVCNSLINPIIYVFRMKDFRKALLSLILTCSRDRPTQVTPQINRQQLH